MSNTSSEQRDSDRRKLRKKDRAVFGDPDHCDLFAGLALLNGFTQTDGQTQWGFGMAYIFGIWGALILAAFIMSRLLSQNVGED